MVAVLNKLNNSELPQAQREDAKALQDWTDQSREALEKQLFEERQDIIRLTVSTRNPDDGALKRINVVIETLCEKHGYTEESANKLLRYVSSLMARN